MSQLKYRALPEFNKSEAERILQFGSLEELIVLPLTIGMNSPSWKIAQDYCIKLSEHKDERVSSNAVMGLAYIARVHRKLEKHLVKPILINGLRKHKEHKGRVQDAIDDINLFLKWKIGVKE